MAKFSKAAMIKYCKRTLELITEGLREAGILLMVFGPLYKMFEHGDERDMLICILLGAVAYITGLLIGAFYDGHK